MWVVGRRVEWRDTPGAATRPKAVWSTEGDGRQRMTVTEAGPLHGDERDEETREPRSVRGVKRARGTGGRVGMG